jgi:hypothetical protein
MAKTPKDKKPETNEAAQHMKEALARIQAQKKQQNDKATANAKSGKGGHDQVGGSGRIFRTQGRG